MNARPNLIVVVSDTFRADYLGCYGNRQIHTPNLDAFARDSLRFTAVHPEALPTIVYRRALHTGRRIYPIRNYRPLKWDIVYLPGWQPIDNAEDTLAENLAEHGYYTGFVTDTLPYFGPGMNFTRGFWQWEFVRGIHHDKWRSPATVSREHLARYGNPDEMLKDLLGNRTLRHVANTLHVRTEAETTTAQVFQRAVDFLNDNRRLSPFYLLVDSFAPHEPWEAPPAYLDRYADPGYQGRTIIHTRYGPMDGQLNEAELQHVKAHYSGLVTLVDAWFGRLVETIKRLGMYDNSVIVFTSDHGTNFADNPERIVGKPSNAMYPGVMTVPLLMRFPDGMGAGKTIDHLVSNVDLVATLYGQSGVGSALGNRARLDGQDLSPLASGAAWQARPYLTCRYGNDLWYRDRENWLLFDLDGQPRARFDLTRDPKCQQNVVGDGSDSVARAWECLLADAGGELPDYRNLRSTDAIGGRQ